MSLEKEIEADIRVFFKQIEGLQPEDKRKALKNLMDKYVHLSRADLVIDKSDFDNIISAAKNKFSNNTFYPYMVSTNPGDSVLNKREIYPADRPNLCVVEATIDYLSGKDCLKRSPKFKYTDK